MTFRDEVIQAWSDADQDKLANLMRLDYELTDQALWEAKALEFLVISEESDIGELELFSLAWKIDGELNNAGKAVWRKYIIPHLLNVYQGKSFDRLEWIVAATGGDLPETRWTDLIPWIQTWLGVLQSIFPADNPFGAVTDYSGFYGPLPGAMAYRPALLHPLVLVALQSSLDPSQVYTRHVVDWLYENALVNPGKEVTVQNAFAAGATVLTLAGADLGEAVGGNSPEWTELADLVLDAIASLGLFDATAPTHWQSALPGPEVDQFESFGLFRATAPAHWQSEEIEQQFLELLNVCPVWHQPSIAAALRARVTERVHMLLTTLAAEYSAGADSLTPDRFRNPLGDVARMPLPKYRSVDRDQRYWDDSRLLDLNRAMGDVTEEGRKQSAHSQQVMLLSTAAQQAGLAVQRVIDKPLCRIVLPEVAKTLSENPDVPSTQATRTFLRERMRFARLQTGAFSFGAVSGLADTSEWGDAIHGRASAADAGGAPIPADATDVLSYWARLEPWDGLRARLRIVNPPLQDVEAADVLWQQVHAEPLFLLLDQDIPDLEQLPAGNDLERTRRRLAMLAHIGHDQWLKLAERIDSYLVEKIGGKKESEAYRLLAAARLELGLTALAAHVPPAIALPDLAGNIQQFGQLLNMANEAFASAYAWESRAGMNALILLARVAEATGDLFTANQLAGGMSSEARALVTASIKTLTENGALLASDLPLAFAAADLTRYARELGVGIANAVNPSPKWGSDDPGETLESLVSAFSTNATMQRIAGQGDLPTRLLVLAVLQIKLDQFERERRLLVRPPSARDRDGFVGLNTLHRLREAVGAVICPGPVLLEGVHGVRLFGVDAEFAASLDKGELPSLLHTRFEEAGYNLIADAAEATMPGQIWTIDNVDMNYQIRKEIAGLGVYLEAFDAPWRSPEFWYHAALADVALSVDEETEEPNLEPEFDLVNWLDSAFGSDSLNTLGHAAWVSSRVPKRLPQSDTFANENSAQAYQNSIVLSSLHRDIDGRYPGELPYLSYQSAKETLDKQISLLEFAQTDYEEALGQQDNDQRTDEIRDLLTQSLLLNTADFREQMQAALAEVRQAEAELEVAEHESLAATFEAAASQLLTAAARLEVKRERFHVQVTELDVEIGEKEAEIATIERDIENDSGDLKENLVKVANLKIEQTNKRKEQAHAQLTAITQEIKFIRKVLGAPDTAPDKADYAIEVPIDGQIKIANGQLHVIAIQTESVLSKQIEAQLKEAHIAYAAAKKKERKARKRAKRNALITGAAKFIGSVVGAIYGGPAGAALGAQIGEAMAELAIGVMDNKPPGDILTGLVDNAFAIAGAAGYDLEAELNEMGKKVGGEITAYLKDFEAKLQPLLAEMPNIVDEELLQGALDVLGLEELNDVPRLSQKLYAGITTDLKGLEDFGTVLKGAAGFDTADQLQTHLKKNLMAETTLAQKQLVSLADRVGVQVEGLLEDPQTQKEALGRIMDRVTPLVTGAIATQAGDFRQKVLKDWITEKRDPLQGGGAKFWNDETVQKEGQALLGHLFPNDERARKAAAANLSEALLHPDFYRGKIKEHMGPFQSRLDTLIGDILVMPPPSAKEESEYWSATIAHLNGANAEFDNRLFPYLRGERVDDEDHPRDEILKKLEKLEGDARTTLGKIEVQAIQKDIDQIDLDSATTMLAQAKKALLAAETEVENAELNVQKDSFLGQMAEISLKKADTLEDAQKQAEQAARERAEATKDKIVAARENLHSKEALLNGARRRGFEAGRIRSALAQPPFRLNLADAQADRARGRYADALQEALAGYRDILRYALSTFFTEDGVPGGLVLPDLIRPDLPSGPEEKPSWHDALTKWKDDLYEVMEGPALDGLISIPTEVFFWDLTPEQIAALTRPSGLRLQVGPDVETDETLFSIPSSLVQVGPLSGEALRLFGENGYPLSERAKFRRYGDLLAVFDPVAEPVTIILHNKLGEPRDKDNEGKPIGMNISGEPKAYRIEETRTPFGIDEDDAIDEGDASEWWQVKRWSQRHSWLHQKKVHDETGRSLSSDFLIENMAAEDARTGRILAIFVGVRDQNMNPITSTSLYDVDVSFLGDSWLEHSSMPTIRSRHLVETRIIEVPSLDTTDAESLKKEDLRAALSKKLELTDGDIELEVAQGTPVGGTTRLRLYVKGQPDAGQTIGAVSIVVLYKYYRTLV